MLEGKAKELFNNWLIGWYLKELNIRRPNPLYLFNQQPPSMQWGVIQDFADSLGYEIGASWTGHWFIIKHFMSNHEAISLSNSSRQEARTAAIEKLNELLNK